MEFLAAHWLDITTTILGLAYIWLEYKASIWLWLTAFVMQALGIVLYYQKGLYADCGMEFYYIAMTIYGFLAWRGILSKKTRGTSEPRPITHFPRGKVPLWLIVTLSIWAAIYIFLKKCTDSTVPLADSFTTALSIVGTYALARKYLEQWYIWIVVDIVTSILYFHKDIPFKASLYALYVIIAILGVRKWRKMMEEKNVTRQEKEVVG
ncbi:MAG: nicotinamide mononucleotide transporter [Bacteroidaceae bacterium]|nr:nicotinamide mononucleotide transporter [Bacteroidaceae bacterium]